MVALLDKTELILKFQEVLQSGADLSDIENFLLFLAFSRFVVFVIRYNFTFAVYVNVIGILSAFLWYKHIIYVTGYYARPLLTVPYVYKFAYECYSSHKVNEVLLKLKQTRINPVQIFTDYGQNNEQYRIDFISMIFSVMPRFIREKTDAFYYFFYRDLGPKTIIFIKIAFREISSLLPYVVVVRLNKKYCPYLIRWHWTFLLILNTFEVPYMGIVLRGWNYLIEVLLPQIESIQINDPNGTMSVEYNTLLAEKTGLYLFLIFAMLLHLGFLMLGVLHALFGQYFYFPFIVENTELHIGPRPKYSYYSSGFSEWGWGNEMEFKKKKSKPFKLFRTAKKFLKIIKKLFKKLFFFL